MYDGDLKNRQ